MEKTNFVDQIRIFCRSGHGGAGSRHFARTKFNPLAGPDGGNGGRGGHIILKGNRNLWTLLHLRYFKNVLAEDGKNGSGNNSSGRSGKDIIIEVPLGTIAINDETIARCFAEGLKLQAEESLSRNVMVTIPIPTPTALKQWQQTVAEFDALSYKAAVAGWV